MGLVGLASRLVAAAGAVGGARLCCLEPHPLAPGPHRSEQGLRQAQVAALGPVWSLGRARVRSLVVVVALRRGLGVTGAGARALRLAAAAGGVMRGLDARRVAHRGGRLWGQP